VGPPELSTGAAPELAFNRGDRGVSVYRLQRGSERPAAGQLFVPLAVAERCARSLRFIGEQRQQPAHGVGAPSTDMIVEGSRQQTGDAGAAAGRRGFDHGPRTYDLHDETTDAIAVGLATQPGAVHAYVLGRCRGLAAGRVPAAFARAWGEATALDRSALSPPSALLSDAAVSSNDGTEEHASHAGAASRAHAHLRREIRHGLHLMMQESNPNSYYAQVEHHFT